MHSISLITLALIFSTSLEWCQKFLKKQSGEIISVAYSIDNLYVAVAINNSNVKIYSTQNYAQLKTYTFGAINPSKVRFSKDGKYLGIAYQSNDVIILNSLQPFDLNTTITANHNGHTVDMDFDTTGGLLLTCGKDNRSKLWSIVHGGTWAYLREKLPVAETPTSCRFQPLNNFIVHVTGDKYYVYSQAFNQLAYKSGRQYSQIAFRPDRSLVYTSTINQHGIYQYAGSSNTETNLFSSLGRLYTIDVSANGKYIITGGQSGRVYILSGTGVSSSEIDGIVFPYIILDLKFSRDSHNFIVGLNNSQFYIYSDECGQLCKVGQFFHPTENECQRCPSYMPNCLTCQNLTYCKQCQLGYYLDSSTRVCSPCNITQGCQICSVVDQCNSCAPGYNLVKQTKKCQKCTLHVRGCYLCNQNNQCTTCLGGFYLNYMDNKCKLCQDSFANNMKNCLRCTSENFCTQCKSGYFAQTTGTCEKCDPLCSKREESAAKMVRDTQVQYDLSNSQLYAGYLNKNSLQIWYLIAFGYAVSIFLVINYFTRSFFTYKNPYKPDNGEMILHYLSFASPCLILYPTTVEILSFSYGFMLLNFPWFNQILGQMFGNSLDKSPYATKILFINLNIGSTYAIGLCVIILSLVFGYSIISIFSGEQNKKQKLLQTYFNYLYNIFSYGALFSSILTIQGCFMNPIDQLFSFQKITNSVFYILGILVCLLIFMDLVHSLFKDASKYLYKLRNFLKVILLSLSHLNSTYFFSVMIVLDLFFVVGEYFIVKKQDKNAFVRVWIAKNILLDLGLVLVILFPNKFLSIIIAMAFISISVVLQIYQHFKIGQSKVAVQSDDVSNNRYSKTANKTLNTHEFQITTINQNRRKIQWDLDSDYVADPNMHQNSYPTFISEQLQLSSKKPQLSSKKPQMSSKKLTQRFKKQQRLQYKQESQNYHQTIEYEPRKRRQRRKQTLTGNNNSARNQSSEHFPHLKQKNRYVFDNSDLQKISDF